MIVCHAEPTPSALLPKMRLSVNVIPVSMRLQLQMLAVVSYIFIDCSYFSIPVTS